MAARGAGDRFEKAAIFCLGCSKTCLGVAAKLVVPEFPAAEKTVVRLSSWVRQEVGGWWLWLIARGMIVGRPIPAI